MDRTRPHIDIGDEPPLSLEGTEGLTPTRSPINKRWLSGTILIGVTGLTLLGGAILTAATGAARLAEAPQTVRGHSANEASAARGSNRTRKTNQIAAVEAIKEARQSLRMTTASKVGGREVVRTRSVVRISTHLSPEVNGKLDIPAFNPLSLVADSGDAAAPAPREAGPDSDADISYTMRSLTEGSAPMDQTPEIPLKRILESVQETAALTAMVDGATRTALPGDEAGNLTMSGNNNTADFDFGARLRMSNMTVMHKSNPAALQRDLPSEIHLTVGPNEKLDEILVKNGVAPELAREINVAFGAQNGYGTGAVRQGQTLDILRALTAPHLTPLRVIVRSGEKIEASVALNDESKYVPVSDTTALAEAVKPGADADVDEDMPADDEDNSSNASLYRSFYATALQQNMPKPVIDELIRIFAYDTDFQRKVGAGDSFEVIFGLNEESKDDKPEILYSALTTDGETKRYYRFQSADDGSVDYFDEDGRSASKFLLRKPVANAVMRSGFGARRHPVLGYVKMHTGVDWAAPRGTPIYAAGNGVVEKADWQGGYGRFVKLRHANGYETAYGHMSAFANGLKEGSRVRQGQLIGYIGSTGLSTGPHVHFEVLVNGHFVDPMRIRLPRDKELSGDELAQFQRERERLDALLGHDVNAAQAGGGNAGG